MKLSSRPKRFEHISDLSSPGFIDVVFLLLIFFLVTSTFLHPERKIASNIAVREDNSARAEDDLEPAVVNVKIVDQRPIFTIGNFTATNEAKLVEFLTDFNKQDGAFVRADDDVPFEFTAKAIGACQISGFDSVTFIPQSE